MDGKLKVYPVEKKDLELLFTLINEMALYEKRPQDMTGSVPLLEYWLFERAVASAYIAEYQGKTVGYAIHYPVFGSFSSKGRVHLEDIYIREEFRRQGMGKEFFSFIASRILEEGYAGLEWNCLSWNKNALDFYDRIGAKRETGREYFYFSQEQLEKFF